MKQLEDAKKKGNAHLLSFLFSENEKNLVSEGKNRKKTKNLNVPKTETFKQPTITKDEKGRTIVSDYRYSTRERKAIKNPRNIYHTGDVYLLGIYDFFVGYKVNGEESDGKIYIDTGGIVKLIERGRVYKHNALSKARNVLNGVFDKPFIGKNHESGAPALYAYSVDDKGVFWRIVIDLEGEHAGMITTLIDDDNHAKRRYQSIQNGTESKKFSIS